MASDRILLEPVGVSSILGWTWHRTSILISLGSCWRSYLNLPTWTSHAVVSRVARNIAKIRTGCNILVSQNYQLAIIHLPFYFIFFSLNRHLVGKTRRNSSCPSSLRRCLRSFLQCPDLRVHPVRERWGRPVVEVAIVVLDWSHQVVEIRNISNRIKILSEKWCRTYVINLFLKIILMWHSSQQFLDGKQVERAAPQRGPLVVAPQSLAFVDSTRNTLTKWEITLNCYMIAIDNWQLNIW